MIAALAILGPIAFIWAVGNMAGWLTIRDAGPRPWNWRVLAGPPLYYRWLDR